jgi:hypothetical protein
MTGRKGAHRGSRNPFLLAHAAIAMAAAGLVAAAFVFVHPRPHPPPVQPLLAKTLKSPAVRPEVVEQTEHATIPSRSWGHVYRGRRGMVVTLGPAADRRRKYEHGSAQVGFASAGLAVSNDRGKTFFILKGEPMGSCGYHWQGYGVNAILATRDCVPGWATSSAGRHAKQWLRIENLVPFARMVLVKFF